MIKENNSSSLTLQFSYNSNLQVKKWKKTYKGFYKKSPRRKKDLKTHQLRAFKVH